MIGFRVLDAVLRGEPAVRDGDRFPLGALVRANLLLAAGYGVCMGVYGILRPENPEYRQALASAVKVPALFGLTLLVTFPSLYVFNTLLGSRLRFLELARLVVGGLSVLVAVLAAFGPIVAFFSASTTSYPFILLLNVTVFAVSGAFGLSALHRSLGTRPPAEPLVVADVEAGGADEERRPVARPVRGGRNAVFYVWMAVFGMVGSQMGWVLRPFVGSPDLGFTWLRPRESSFLEAVVRSARALLGW